MTMRWLPIACAITFTLAPALAKAINEQVRCLNGVYNNPLHQAIYLHDAPKVKRLLARGADPDATEYGKTALALAAIRNETAMVRVLLHTHAHVNARPSGTAMTAFEHAASGSNPEIVRLMLAHGANVNRDGKGAYTPLMYAAAGGNSAAVRLLLSAGADMNARDGRGRSVLRIAHEAAQRKCAGILERAGAEDSREVPPIRTSVESCESPDIDGMFLPPDPAERWLVTYRYRLRGPYSTRRWKALNDDIPSSPSDLWTDVPRSDPAYANLAILRRLGAIRQSEPTFETHPAARYEFGVVLSRYAPHYAVPLTTPDGRRITAEEIAECRAAFGALVAAFRAEIRLLAPVTPLPTVENAERMRREGTVDVWR
jgi:hypothetical protein